MGVRKPAVAGYFYPSDPDQLRGLLARLIEDVTPKVSATAVVSPHAGYIYSGRTAGRVYGRVRLPRRFIILCPNHTGMGAPLACWATGLWETPLGPARVDEETARHLMEQCTFLVHDPVAHLREHSLEVHLPFLQYLLDDFVFVPVCVGTPRMTQLTALAQAIAEVVRGLGEEVLLIASTDMTHYTSAAEAARLDPLAIRCMEQVDGPGLYDTVHRHRLTMCGYLPTTVVLMAARELGATRGTLVDYTHSGMVTGDDTSVVSYVGMVIA